VSAWLAFTRAALRAVARSTVWWSVALALVVIATLAFWPAFRGASGISQAIDSLPGPVIEAFGLQDFGSPAGFLRGNLYELLVPLLFSVASVALINGQTASDEAAGRLELFLSQPVDRRALFLARAVACGLALGVIVVVTVVVQLAMDAIVDLNIAPSYVIATALLCGLLGLFFGSVAYLVACLRPRPSLVIGLGIGLMLAGYLVSALFQIATALDPWKVISPWQWALGGNPLEHPAETWRWAVLIASTLALAVVGTLSVSRRDVAAA
jgi:beta-exotoxin I transport system permease protein